MTTPSTISSAASIVVGAVQALKLSKDPGYFRLRRGSEFLHAMLEPIFPKTQQALQTAGHRVLPDNLACALLLAPHVVGDKARLGSKLGNKKHPYSPLRFQQLVTADSPAEFFTHVRRALLYVNGQVSAFDVAELALNWTEHNADRYRRKLVSDYHSIKPVSA